MSDPLCAWIGWLKGADLEEPERRPSPLGRRDLGPRLRATTALQRRILEAGLAALRALREVIPRERLRAAFEPGARPCGAGAAAGH